MVVERRLSEKIISGLKDATCLTSNFNCLRKTPKIFPLNHLSVLQGSGVPSGQTQYSNFGASTNLKPSVFKGIKASE